MKIAGTILILTALFSEAFASFSGTGNPIDDPNLAGGVVQDFESVALGDYATLTTGGITYTAVDYGVFSISSDYSGLYNTTGLYLDNEEDGPDTIRFDFASPVSAFGFNFGASNDTWTLTAYNSSGIQLDQIVIPILEDSNNKEYYGVNAAGIAYAMLTSSSAGDWILIDNVTYVSYVTVPLSTPFKILLGLLLAMASVLMMQRNKRAQA